MSDEDHRRLCFAMEQISSHMDALTSAVNMLAPDDDQSGDMIGRAEMRLVRNAIRNFIDRTDAYAGFGGDLLGFDPGPHDIRFYRGDFGRGPINLVVCTKCPARWTISKDWSGMQVTPVSVDGISGATEALSRGSWAVCVSAKTEQSP